MRNLVKDIVKTINVNYDIKDLDKENEYKKDFDDEYAEKVDGDLLRYYLILRFLKLRDLKFNLLNMLNYFRFIQKRFAIDLYKLENKNWNREQDTKNLNESKINKLI